MILSGVQWAVAVLFTAMLAVILAVVLLCYDNTQFYFKIHFLLPQGLRGALFAAASATLYI